MKRISDDVCVAGVQDYWLVRVGGGSPYANILEALGPAAGERHPTRLYVLAGPHQGAVIDPEQQERLIRRLAKVGRGVEQWDAEAAERLWKKRK